MRFEGTMDVRYSPNLLTWCIALSTTQYNDIRYRNAIRVLAPNDGDLGGQIAERKRVNAILVIWTCWSAQDGDSPESLQNSSRISSAWRVDFFFSRSAAGFSNLHILFATLAYQLATIYPEFGFELDAIIKEDESVLTKNLEV
ncbi:hypothetical protein BDN70DRAFT_248952 [Pholiota conissans]|uniref:Uncharacterized protein n=1 Tax=Pholiota conissans TaxID=109636 RepID=A0A9P5YUS5_9AGAR|nr:hypothetical protein BDN70DRAFT_248952 [Pholiota conissans]